MNFEQQKEKKEEKKTALNVARLDLLTCSL